MSAAFWIVFFRDAGIPLSLAKSYAATFEENRIGKDMLLDLDKDILADMGIKVMGDVIGILKHAKKEARKDCPTTAVSGTSTKLPKPSSAVHSTQSAPQAPAVSTTSSPLHTHSDEGFMGEAGLIEYQDREPELATEEPNLQPVEQFSTLHSDQLLLQQVVAAVAQQQAQQQEQQQQQQLEEEELGGHVNPVLLGLQEDFQEEYVTEAYKRQQQKRALGTLYSDSIFVEPQPKQPRLVILPHEGTEEGGGEELHPLGATSDSSDTSGRRMLEAAGLVKREQVHFSPTEKAAASSSVSVFSRLDGKSDTPPSSTKHYPPHTLTPSSTSASGRAPNLKRTIVTATSPSPKKLNLRVTSNDGRKVSGIGSSSGTGSRSTVIARKSGTKRELSSGGLVSSSSSFTSKEPVKSRLGTRGSDHRVTSRAGGGSGLTNWPETVSSSIAATSTSGRVSTRLGGGGVHRTSATAARKPRPTMMADSASNPQPKAISRLGSVPKTSKSTATVSSAASSRPRGSSLQKSKPASMVADEYELKRQLDIRSRLDEKEKEVRDRRSGLLHGRLGQHRVFKRLT